MFWEVEMLTGSEHFWKLSCWKSARRRGAKHMSKSKCASRTMLGALLEVERLKKGTLLWHEARLEVKKCKAPHVRTVFGRSRHYNYNDNHYYNYSYHYNYNYITLH